MMNSGFILPPDLMDQIGDERAKMERAELQAYRDIAATYTPNGTADELQACLESCEELTVPAGWSDWYEGDIFTLASEQDGYDEMVMESTVYQQDLEALQDQIDDLEDQDDKIVELRAWVDRNQDEIDRLRTVIDEEEEIVVPEDEIHALKQTNTRWENSAKQTAMETESMEAEITELKAKLAQATSDIGGMVVRNVVEGSADAEIALLKSKLETSLWCNEQQGKLLTEYHERLWSGGLVIGHTEQEEE